MIKLKDKLALFSKIIKSYLCELKKKDIKFSDIVKFLFKILILIFLFCVLATTIFKSCSNSNKNYIEPKKQLKTEVLENKNILGTWLFNDKLSFETTTYTFNVDFESNSIKYTTMVWYIGKGDGYFAYNETHVFSLDSGDENGGGGLFPNNAFWLNKTYKTIRITDVSNLTNRTEFETFLKSNATKKAVEPPHECPWSYDGGRNGIYKFSENLWSKGAMLTLLFDFSSCGGNFNKFMVGNGKLLYGNENSSEIYQVALYNEDTKKWDFTKQEDKYINLKNFKYKQYYDLFDQLLIKNNQLKQITLNQFQQEIAKIGFDSGVEISQSANNSIVLFFTQLFQLPYMIFTTLFSPFTFELGGISINLGSALLGLMLVLLIVWVMKKFK